MSKQAFDKFINKEVSGAKKKEAIKQEKKRVKAELRAEGEERRRLKEERRVYGAGNRSQVTGRTSPVGDRRQETGDRRPVAGRKSPVTGDRTQQPVTRNMGPATGSRRPATVNLRPATSDQRPATYNRQPATGNRQPSTSNRQPATRDEQPATGNWRPATGNRRPAARDQQPEAAAPAETMPLNKFLAHSGVCARREAAEVVKHGKVLVNGQQILEPGFKVSSNDTVSVSGKKLFLQRNLVYILLNKPKDHITTVSDPEGRKTVFDIVSNATRERVFPVGRLDRNTTGVLLMTNDGELTQKLTHPSFEIKKVYEVTLDKPLTKRDFDAILKGVSLEDGVVAADSLAYTDIKDKTIIGIEIHSGKNRVVRRIFQHLGYDVKKLDRVMFANLTKKNVERGKWRFLNEKEVRLLKYMNQSFVRNIRK